MKILLTLAHYFNPSRQGPYSSLWGNAAMRVSGITTSISAFHQLFGKRRYMMEYTPARAFPVPEEQRHDVDVVVCTTGDQHLLAQVPLPGSLYYHHATRAESMYLPFECHAVLRDSLGKYDYFCYTEEDLVIHDPWFFRKLAWFNRLAGNGSVLHPNRFELSYTGPAHKLYLDGELPPEKTAPFQNIEDQTEIRAEFLDQPVRFARGLNPHSGCFFLNAEQMAHWAGQPYFLDRDRSFSGPLESAATLGIMRTFRVYKPALESPDFLEIQHHDLKYLCWIGGSIPLEDPARDA